MIRHAITASVLVGALGGALALSFSAGRATAPANAALASQPEGMPGPEEIKAMMAQTAAMAPEHDRLKELVGLWNAKMNFLVAPGAPPETSQVKAEIKPVLGGRYVQLHYKGIFTYMGAEIDFEGLGMIGYDKAAGHYISAWGDNLSTSMLIETGPYKDGAIDIEGSMTDAMGGQTTMRHRHIINDDGSYTLEFYQPGPTGEMMKIGWIEHTKD